MEERKINTGGVYGCYGCSNDGYLDGWDCIHKAWPWQRLNEDEKRMIDGLFSISRPKQEISYEEAWDMTSDIWNNCLKLVGYQPLGWREDKDGKPIIPPCDTEYILVPRKQLEALKKVMTDLNKVI